MAGKTAMGLAERNGRLLPGLWVISTAGRLPRGWHQLWPLHSTYDLYLYLYVSYWLMWQWVLMLVMWQTRRCLPTWLSHNCCGCSMSSMSLLAVIHVWHCHWSTLHPQPVSMLKHAVQVNISFCFTVVYLFTLQRSCIYVIIARMLLCCGLQHSAAKKEKWRWRTVIVNLQIATHNPVCVIVPGQDNGSLTGTAVLGWWTWFQTDVYPHKMHHFAGGYRLLGLMPVTWCLHSHCSLAVPGLQYMEADILGWWFDYESDIYLP